MLSTQELAGHLTRLSYKPRWEFTIRDGRWEGQHLTIRTSLEDSFHPGQPVVLDIHSKVPPMQNLDQFEEWLAWRLGRIELHEMREWLKRDGQPIFDPHAEYAERDVA